MFWGSRSQLACDVQMVDLSSDSNASACGDHFNCGLHRLPWPKSAPAATHTHRQSTAAVNRLALDVVHVFACHSAWQVAFAQIEC